MCVHEQRLRQLLRNQYLLLNQVFGTYIYLGPGSAESMMSPVQLRENEKMPFPVFWASFIQVLRFYMDTK